jgi:hypothetical protein
MFKSPQTKILGITTLLATLAGAFFYLFKGEAHKSGSFLLFAAIPMFINLYTVHCLIYGKCTVYSWLLTVVLTLYTAGIFILYAKLFVKGEEIRQIVQEKTKEANSLQATVENSLGLN